PEILLLDPKPYDIRSDMWALGISVREIASGTHPFCNMQDYELYDKIKTRMPTVHSIISEEMATLTMQLYVGNLNIVNKKVHPSLDYHLAKIANLKPYRLNQSSTVHIEQNEITVKKSMYSEYVDNCEIRQRFNLNENDSIEYFSTLYIKDIRFTIDTLIEQKNKTDCVVLFKLGQTEKSSQITAIFRTKQQIFLKFIPLDITEKLSVTINNEKISVPNLMIERLLTNNQFYLKPQNLIEKLSIYYDQSSNRHVFLRFPTLVEST
ncbi:unnamed protein product, partial [Didymodactylos carnosus]